ncbi:hypothetical protein CR511_06965 [Pseudomonas putida]|nr:hypothetical protein CR511_06965 [Pseudomonas putida]
MVRVYDISAFDKRTPEVDLTNVKPVHEWILAEAQQERAQWVQGFAVYGDTVYVLTGNAKKAGVKYLGTYSISGDIESIDELPNSSSGKIMSGKIRAYEPEGLEVVSNQNGLQLAFGMAGGTKGRRTYDLWLIPLKRK